MSLNEQTQIEKEILTNNKITFLENMIELIVNEIKREKLDKFIFFPKYCLYDKYGAGNFRVFYIPFVNNKDCNITIQDTKIILTYGGSCIIFHDFVKYNFDIAVNVMIHDLKKHFYPNSDTLSELNKINRSIQELKEEFIYSPANVGRTQERINQFQEKVDQLNLINIS